MNDYPFTPTQSRLLATLRRDSEPLVFDEEAVGELVDEAKAAVAELSLDLGGETLWVSKAFLRGIHGCERHHLLPPDFTWNPATAAGFVAHKAIELGVHWPSTGERSPAAFVDAAIESLRTASTARGDFVSQMTPAEHAELRSRAVERATRFLQDFPPLDARSHPVLEASRKWAPFGTIQLSGKVDLVIGRPHGRESRRLIIDFKTGGRSPTHHEDLRFYALLETLVAGVPPRRLVTYYLDYADCEIEDVTLALLRASLARTLDAIRLHIELTVGQRQPVVRVGATCRWCPVADECAPGAAHRAELQRSSR